MTRTMKLISGALLSVMLTGGTLVGCSTGNCRSQKENSMKAEQKDQKPIETPLTGELDRVKVYKYDGSLQCGMGKPIAAEVMQKDLKTIPVFSAINKADGLMHIQQCGTPTGTANVYEIDKKDLEAAKKLGFKLWTW